MSGKFALVKNWSNITIVVSPKKQVNLLMKVKLKLFGLAGLVAITSCNHNV